MLIASYHISILKKIDSVIETDMYIGGSERSNKYLPIEVFNLLIFKFPKSAELKLYTNARISNVIKEYFGETEIHEIALQKFLKHRSSLAEPNITYSNKLVELEQFKSLSKDLEQLLNDAEGIDENSWQSQILNIIRFLYPKYILGAREITIHGVDGYGKRPDYLLIDINGYVDIMEIKKPSAQQPS